MFTSTVATVLCAGCGELITDEAVNFCTRCGTPRPREPFFYSMSLPKLAFFGATTFGLYVFWWFWSQFRAEDPKESRPWIGVKVIFCTFFFYMVARQAKGAALDQSVACRYSPLLLAALFLATCVAADRVPDEWVIVPALFLPVPLLPVQSAINQANALTSRGHPQPWRRWEKVLAGVLALVWVLVILIILAPVPAEDGEQPPLTDLAQMAPPVPASPAPAKNLTRM